MSKTINRIGELILKLNLSARQFDLSIGAANTPHRNEQDRWDGSWGRVLFEFDSAVRGSGCILKQQCRYFWFAAEGGIHG